jgi:ferric-dicitrate binding protein FerR (iron transport regulator)
MKQVGRFSKLLAYTVVIGAAFAVTAAHAAQGTATVRAVRGTADYSDGSGQWKSLRVGKVLKQGSIIRTAADSQVDLFLKDNGPVVRVTESTQLGLDRLTYERTPIETVIDTGLDLKSGRILGNVKKMAEASKYEVETPNGVAGIRGTEYDISADGKVSVVSGQVVVVTIRPGQPPVTSVVNAGQTFSPSTGQVTATPPQVNNAIQSNINNLIAIIPTDDGGVAIVIPTDTAIDPEDASTDVIDNVVDNPYEGDTGSGSSGGGQP